MLLWLSCVGGVAHGQQVGGGEGRVPQPRNLNISCESRKNISLKVWSWKNVQIVISSATVVIMVDIQGQMRERFMNSKMFTQLGIAIVEQLFDLSTEIVWKALFKSRISARNQSFTAQSKWTDVTINWKVEKYLHQHRAAWVENSPTFLIPSWKREYPLSTPRQATFHLTLSLPSCPAWGRPCSRGWGCPRPPAPRECCYHPGMSS